MLVEEIFELVKWLAHTNAERAVAIATPLDDRFVLGVAVGFLVGQEEGMEPGFYLLDGKKESWASVSSGQFMARSTSICLDQAWLVNAGAHFLFLANLEVLDKTWGPRGYRYAMLTAGRLGQRLYVAAEAMGMGCCGIGALYDSEAMDMLGLNESSRLLYLVAVGNVKRV